MMQFKENFMSDNKNYRLETMAVHAGISPDPRTGAVMTPIYQTSTYAQSDVAVHSGYEYSRTDNPTRTVLHDAIAGLERANYALAFSSGMAAIDTLLRLMKPGDHVLSGNDVYGGTFRLFDKILSKYGIEFGFADTTSVEAVAEALQPNTRLVWLETPTNPMLRISDIAGISAVVHKHGAWLGVDNTFASPALQRPLTLGADFVVHSTTKYIGGHSDVVGGVIALNDKSVYDELKYLQNAIGAVPGPMDCFLTLRGLKTLAIRMAQHCRNATQIAQFLADHPAVAEVIYPGLDSHPQHQLAKEQMDGPGGMISFVLHGGEAAARTIATELKLFTLAESLGGVESLIELPAPMTHASVADSPLAIDPGLVRLSVGIENAQDLMEDLGAILKRL
jgi:cystathionine beta-lyase/cystathionine gamma-synthase